jgi:hypothetical protein
MMLRYRKRLPAALVEPFERFEAVLELVEPAKAALAQVMPTTRLPGRPLPDAILAFETQLAAAHEEMPGWRVQEVEEQWEACAAGLTEALTRARRFRDEPPELTGFEGLVWAVGELLAPLEPFEATAERFARLRTRRAPDRAPGPR